MAPRAHSTIVSRLGRFTVNPELVAHVFSGAIRLLLPGRHEAFDVDPDTFQLLCSLTGRHRAGAVARLLKTYSGESVRASVDAFVAQGLLVPRARRPTIAERWSDWGMPAWALHLDSRNVRYALSESEQTESLQRTVSSEPAPGIYRCLCRKTVSRRLPRPLIIESRRFTDVLLARRTCRNYQEKPLTAELLSTLLFHACGAVSEFDTQTFGTVLLKMAPSPGARHSTEGYLFVRDVEGLKRGLYHYCVKHHALNFIRPAGAEFIKKALHNQPYFEKASFAIFFATAMERMYWKYKSSRCYRLAHLEVGHYCQNLLTAGTALGLGVYQTGSFDDSYVEGMFGLDGVSDYVVYAAGAGYAARDDGRYMKTAATSHVPPGTRPGPVRIYDKFEGAIRAPGGKAPRPRRTRKRRS